MVASLPNHTDTTASHLTTFRVAIIGGGIGGLALAHGLKKHPNIDFHVYEAAPAFGEIGAGVSLGPNAQRALELIGSEAKEAFTKHATPNLWPSHSNTYADLVIGKGPEAGKIIACQKNAIGQQSVHRSSFLDELVKGVPSWRSHFNKRLLCVDNNHDGSILLYFKDGTTTTADAVIGADGIHSAVRAHLLGKEAARPVFSGTTAYRGLVPMDEAIEKLGDELAQNCYMSCGPNQATLSYPIESGTLLNIVALNMQHDTWASDKWIVPAKWSELDEMFAGWGKQSRGVIELLNTENLSTWALWDMPPAPTYTTRNVCMMGDAAHATTPFQGSGAGQAIEDALVLETLLGKVEDPLQIPVAFSAYDQVRRPRTQKVVSTSREAGQVFAMRAEGIGKDVEKMARNLETRMHWIWGRDLGAQNREAVRLFEESL